jgi:hypothetical protein
VTGYGAIGTLEATEAPCRAYGKAARTSRGQADERHPGHIVVQIEHDRAFVAGVDLPMQFVTTVAPVAQRIVPRRLDLDHAAITTMAWDALREQIEMPQVIGHRDELVMRVKAYIEAKLADPELSVERIAHACSILPATRRDRSRRH